MLQNGEEKTARTSGIAWILLLACLLRLTAVAIRFENLQVDTDAYLAISQNLLDGHGYCSTPGQPSAFRPPLYPLLLAGCLWCGGFAAIGLVQILLGTATVWMTWLIGLQCQFSQRTSVLAAFLVAVDPLLIHYTTQAMTETLFTFLVTLLLMTALQNGVGLRRSVATGIVFGLTALCRPSIWAFGGLAALVWLAKTTLSHSTQDSSTRETNSLNFKRAFACAAAIVVVISPWALRNAREFGRPIVMTTHGGYTLLLGNNETFFQQVVNGEHGATWQAASLRNWQSEIERRITEMKISATDEVARDVAQSAMAHTWIIDNPLRFLRACLLRIQRFWACWPSTSADLPQWLTQLVGVYYAGVFTLAVVGAVRGRSVWLSYWPLATLVLALTLVHSVYWSNARMRSPAVPIISLATASAFQRFRLQKTQ